MKRGQATTYAAWAHSVHVEAKGLQPGHEYWYRFEVAGHVSPVGRTRTAPAPWSSVAGLTFASVSCQAYDYGFFTSYPHIVEDDPDFVLHLGDYVYEYGMSATAGNRGTPVPQIVQKAPSNLEQWRATHALYKQDPSLQEAHRLLPFVLTWDDHEYFNDYAGGSPDPGRTAVRRRRGRRRTRPTGSTCRCGRRRASSPARSGSTAGCRSAACCSST